MSFRVSFISVFLCIALLGSMAGAELTAVRLSADSQSDEVFAHWQGDLSDGARLDISDPGKQDLTRGGEVDAFNLSLSYRPLEAGPAITVWSGEKDASIWEWSPYAIPSGLSFVVPFENFVPLSGNGANFTSITRIEFEAGLLEAEILKNLNVQLKADATLVATKTVQIQDINFDSRANPGEQLKYFIQIQNQGSSNANDVLLTDIPDAKTKLINGTVTTTSGTVSSGNQPGANAVTVSIPVVGVAPCQPQLVTVALTVEIDLPFLGGGEPVCNQASLFSPDSPVAQTNDPNTPAASDPTCIAVLLSEAQSHAVDTDGDGLVKLSELLRAVQLFNADRYGCEDATEDSYAPNDLDESCKPHDMDYAPQDWIIKLSELLRVVQFFNLGGYYFCPEALPSTEDNFCGII